MVGKSDAKARGSANRRNFNQRIATITEPHVTTVLYDQVTSIEGSAVDRSGFQRSFCRCSMVWWHVVSGADIFRKRYRPADRDGVSARPIPKE